MKTKNFNAKNASIIGREARKDFSCFGACVRVVRNIFDCFEVSPESLPDDVAVSVAATIKAGVNPKTDLNVEFIRRHLNGSQWIAEDGQILERVKGELVPVERWTPNKVMQYVRRANGAQLKSLGIK